MGVSPSIYLPFSNWSLKPKLGEPARGYFLRLVANEGHDSTTVYGNEIGINGRRLAAEEALDTMLMLPLAEEHKEALRRYSPVADGAYYDICGQRLRQRQMNVRTRRFCRACLADSPHHRVWWDIVAFGTCPEHGTPVEKTDASGQPIGWWWADVASDMDGNPLGKWARSQPELHARTLEGFILERLDVFPSTAWPLLDRYRLYEVIEACEYLGTWLGNERTFAVPVDQLGNIALGMEALSGDRDDLVAAMRRWFEERVPSDIRREGKMASMGWAWNAWPKMPGTEIGDMLNQAATDAFEPIGKMGKKRYREMADFYAERALSAFADGIGIRLDALLPLACHVGVARGITEPWELTPPDEDILKAAIANLVPTAEVSRILAVESWGWHDLVGRGKLAVFANFELGRMYLRSDVERLLGRAIGMASETAQGTTVSLRTYARRHDISIGDVVVMVLDGGLKAVRADCAEPGLRAIRVLAHSRRRRENDQSDCGRSNAT